MENTLVEHYQLGEREEMEVIPGLPSLQVAHPILIGDSFGSIA